MIVTVTPNTAADQVLFISSFEKNHTMRAVNSTYSMGGKPTDASWILGEIGVPSLALGFAAGAMGRKVESLLQARGVITDFVETNGETRLITVIIDASDGTQSTITTSTLEVNADHVVALRQKYEAALNEATCVVLGGTVPKGAEPTLFNDLIGLARARNIPVVFDASDNNLKVGIAAKPNFIKPNRDELGALVGSPIRTVKDAYQAGCVVLDRYGTIPVISLGSEGGLAVLPDRAYRIPALKVKAVNAAGAGDAVLAGLAAALHGGQPIEEGLRLGFAAATAVVLQPGTADCRRSDVEMFLPQIELIPYTLQ